MLKKRQSCDHVIFNIGIPILRKDSLYIEMEPRWPSISTITAMWPASKLWKILENYIQVWDDILTPIYWPRGQNIVGVKISSHTGITIQESSHATFRNLLATKISRGNTKGLMMWYINTPSGVSGLSTRTAVPYVWSSVVYEHLKCWSHVCHDPNLVITALLLNSLWPTNDI